MKNIILILTGGTIGSCESGGVISTDSSRCRILDLYNQSYSDCRFTVYRPLDILSEELCPACWEKLLNFIFSLDTKGFDGIIITHGSDTLSWTSAMLGACLKDHPIPVMITAADLVPDDPVGKAAQRRDKGQRHHGGDHIEDGVEDGDGHRRGLAVPEREVEDGLGAVHASGK